MSKVRDEAFRFSAALTLLDLRVGVPPSEGEEDVKKADLRSTRLTGAGSGAAPGEAVGVRCLRGSLAGRFVSKAFGILTEVLQQQVEVRLSVRAEGHILLADLLTPANQRITEAEAAAAVQRLEGKLQDMEAFGWEELVENICKESKQLLAGLPVAEATPGEGEWEDGVAPNLDKTRVRSVQVEKIVPCGLPDMEYSFSAGGTQILYPDPAAFTDDHWKLWAEYSPYAARRGMLDYVYAAATWIPHEVLHCVQDGALGTSGAAQGSLALHNWQCEYAACCGQGLFLAAIVGENRKRGRDRTLLLPSHFLEESLLWLQACVAAQPATPLWNPESFPPGVPDGTQPYDYHENSFPSYITLLGTVVVQNFERYQALVEQDEQVTSYWAEFIKYTNKLLKSTSPDKIPEVAAAASVVAP